MAEETSPQADALVETSVPIVEYAAYSLNKDGSEGTVLAPLGEYPETAKALAVWLMDADDPYIRTVAALIPGYATRGDPELLRQLWEAELSRRDQQSKSNDEAEAAFAQIEANTVAERILISAVRLLRHGEPHRSAALGVLKDMVERAIGGENWNDAHFALSALCKAGHADHQALLERFENVAAGPDYFPQWARSLRAGDEECLNQAEVLAEEGPKKKLSRKLQKQLESFLEAARAYEEAES